MQSSFNFTHAGQTFHKNRAVTNCVAPIKWHGAPSLQARLSCCWQTYDVRSFLVRKIFSQNIFNRKRQINFVLAKLHSNSCNSDLMIFNGRPVSSSVESEIVFSLNTQFLWSRVLITEYPALLSQDAGHVQGLSYFKSTQRYCLLLDIVQSL